MIFGVDAVNACQQNPTIFNRLLTSPEFQICAVIFFVWWLEIWGKWVTILYSKFISNEKDTYQYFIQKWAKMPINLLLLSLAQKSAPMQKTLLFMAKSSSRLWQFSWKFCLSVIITSDKNAKWPYGTCRIRTNPEGRSNNGEHVLIGQQCVLKVHLKAYKFTWDAFSVSADFLSQIRLYLSLNGAPLHFPDALDLGPHNTTPESDELNMWRATEAGTVCNLHGPNIPQWEVSKRVCRV